MKRHLWTTWIVGAVCSLAISSCHNKQELQKPIESITYDEASGFTLITDTVKIDMNCFNGRYKELYINSILKQRGQYKIVFCLTDLSSFPTPYMTTLDKNLSPLNDTIISPFLEEGDFSHLYTDPYQNEAIIYCYDSIDWETEKRAGHNCLNLDTGEETFYPKGTYPFSYQDDYIQAEYIDVGEFGIFEKFHSKDGTRHTCFYMPNNRLLRWHDNYYGIAAKDIFKVENPLADGPVSIVYNEARAALQDSICHCAHSIPDLELQWHPFSNGYEGNCQKDTVYITGFIHNDKLYIVESRPNDGFYLMQLDEKDNKSEVLRICDFEHTSDRVISKHLNLQPSSYAFFPLLNDWKISGFMEIRSDTIRMAHLQFDFEGIKQ